MPTTPDASPAPPSTVPVAGDGASGIDTLLLAATRIATYEHDRALTNASGFFFSRDDRLYLVTSGHVLYDQPSSHFPNRIEIEFHTSQRNLTQASVLSMLVYADGKSVWKQGSDTGGDIDVAVVPVDRSALPADAVFHAFGPAHLQVAPGAVEVGSSALIVGFPLGFHDTLHHLPVVRQSVIASAFGIRFQGKGYFLTDARTHRGTSGAPVVMRDPAANGAALPWKLLGVHSARLDMKNRDLVQDESLGLNSAWYADILMALTTAPTAPTGPASPTAPATLPAPSNPTGP